MKKNIFFLILFFLSGNIAFAGTATLTWNANSESDLSGYRVYYGTSSRGAIAHPDSGGYPPANEVEVYSATTKVLNSLSEGVTYYFSVTAFDTSGNESNYSTEVSKFIPVSADTTPPIISSISSGTPSISGATITWTTNEGATSQVEYGLTTSYGNTTVENDSLVTSHGVTLSSLSSGTTYHYRVRSRDTASNSTTSADQTFTTASQTSSSGGGGGGGGGSSSSNTSTDTTTQKTTTCTSSVLLNAKDCVTTTTISKPSTDGVNTVKPASPTLTTTTAYNFTRDLAFGSKGADVVALQNILIAQKFLAPGNNTGNFYAMTQSALMAYQRANNIVPAAGYFGPLTRTHMNRTATKTTTDDEISLESFVRLLIALNIIPKEKAELALSTLQKAQ